MKTITPHSHSISVRSMKPLFLAMACAGMLPALAQNTPGLPQGRRDVRGAHGSTAGEGMPPEARD